jgi:hypothetical protein
MGGTDVNSENLKNNDPLQLQQIIIFLKAELGKYKGEVNKYKESDYYSLAEKFKQENVQLIKEKNELSEQLVKLNEEFERRTSDYEEGIHLHEIQIRKYINSIDTLRKTRTDLGSMNEQFTVVINKLNDSIHRQTAVNKTTMGQLEYRLVNLIQEAINLTSSQIEKVDITNKERLHSEKVRQHLLNEIEEKNNTIRKLQLEVTDLKERNEKHNEDMPIVEKNLDKKNNIQADCDILSSSTTPTIDFETLMQLELQIKEILGQSLNYKEKLEAKLLVMDALELKLDRLTVEIDEI